MAGIGGVPSIGDLLMLSQLSWKIGRTFSTGRRAAPVEFLAVEAEVNGLAKALKLLAESLFDENTLLDRADDETKRNVAKIIQACQHTLKDLDSLLEHYQVIKRTRTSGGYSVERTWSDMVLVSFRTMIWTKEGGDIQALRNLLRMHTSSIALTMQALQSKSLSKLEKLVTPMAERIDDIHNPESGELADKIEDVLGLLEALDSETPDTPVLRPLHHRNSVVTVNTIATVATSNVSSLDLDNPYQPTLREPSWSRRSSRATTPTPQTQYPPEVMEYEATEAPSLYRESILRMDYLSSSPSDRTTIRGSPYHISPNFDPQYHVSPNLSPPFHYYEARSARSSPLIDRRPSTRYLHSSSAPPTAATSPAVDDMRIEPAPPRPYMTSPLPPPAMSIDSSSSHRRISSEYSLIPAAELEAVILERSVSTASQQHMFEREVFRNTAILCDVRGALVEYTRPLDEARPYDVELVTASKECRICIVRKRETLLDNSIRLSTSIWVFSDDRSVRMQQELPDGAEIIPFASYFHPTKLAITVPTVLKFHDITYGSDPLSKAPTSWINYILTDEKSAMLFQSELMGRNLLASFKTDKTLRVHEGLSGVLAYQEQMCGMEVLRLWEDERSGGVLAMMHFSAQFREGYLAFWMNSSRVPIRIKDESGREVKIKGLKIPLDAQGKGVYGSLQRQDSGAGSGAKRAEDSGKGRRGSDGKKWISGARIEFHSESEKERFMEVVKGVQRRYVECPNL